MTLCEFCKKELDESSLLLHIGKTEKCRKYYGQRYDDLKKEKNRKRKEKWRKNNGQTDLERQRELYNKKSGKREMERKELNEEPKKMVRDCS